MKSFHQFVAEQDARILQMDISAGNQLDPDKPDNVRIGDLIAAFRDIIDISKRAIQNGKGLGDKRPQVSGTDRKEDDNGRVSRPLADGPGALFGEE